MTEIEAKKRCAELASTSPERETHSWLPRQAADGRWGVVKLAVPSPASPETSETSAADHQMIKDDPRPAIHQNFPPWAAGF